jgi:hypothetical protein
MTSESGASTSSGETERLKDWGRVANLGRQISAELGVDERGDTLSRWIAHRIAELLDRSEKARRKTDRETAAREIEDLILRVWEQRTSWPTGWPPETAARITDLLADRYPRYRSDEEQESPSPWLDALQRLERVHWREKQILLQAALADLDLGDERRGLECYGDVLGDNELGMLKSLTSAQESALAALLKALDEDEAALAAPRRRGEATAERLRSLAEEREDLVNTVLQRLSEPEESKPVKATRRRPRSGSRKSRRKTRQS